MSDPRLERERDLVADVVMAALSGDLSSAEDARSELVDVQMDCLPPRGKARIGFSGAARRVPEVTVTCPDCGAVVHGGGGVAFYEAGAWDETYGYRHPTDEESALAIHHAVADGGCPRLKWRWWRWSHNKSPWERVRRKWLSYVWRHDNWVVSRWQVRARKTATRKREQRERAEGIRP